MTGYYNFFQFYNELKPGGSEGRGEVPWVSDEDWKNARQKHADLRDLVVRIIAAAFLIGMLFGGMTYKLLYHAATSDHSMSARLNFERK